MKGGHFMANSANTQDILDNVTKKYMITNNSTTQEISEAAAAFAADPAHTKILAGGADKQALDIYRTLVKVFRGEKLSEYDNTTVNPADNRVKPEDDKDLDNLFSKENKPGETINLKIGGLNTSWNYDWHDYPQHEFNEVGAAQRLTDAVKEHVAYDVDRGMFRAWNNKRWVWISSEINQLTQLTREILNCMVNEASDVFADESSDGFKDTKKKIDRLGTQPKMIQILKLTQTEDLLGVSNVRYNSENYLINCLNGEIDILTGKLLNHNKEHLFTKIIPFNYNPDNHSDDWDNFLNVTFQSDNNMINYFKMAIGDSALSGINTDRHMYVNYGKNGHDGKSVAMNTIRHVLGGDATDGSGFADTADIKTFLKNKSASGSSARPDLANLDGVRLVTPTEPSKNDELDEGAVKSMTGKSDSMKVRDLYSSVFTMNPQFSIWISANDIPKSSASQAIMDRLVIIPFDHRIKKNSPEDNPNIENELSTTKNSEGILTWLVQGSVEAHQRRIQAKKEAQQALNNKDYDKVIYQDPLMPWPDSVERARNKYQYSANSALSFIFDVIYSQDEMMNIVIDSILSNDRAREYVKRGIDEHPQGMDVITAKKIFNEYRLVFDESAYITKSDLYKMYQEWSREQGMRNPATKRSFHDSVESILQEGWQNGSRVWLGIGAMPHITEGFRTVVNTGNYASFLKHIAMKYDLDHLQSFSKSTDHLFVSDDKSTKSARDQLNSFIDVAPESYAHKYHINFDNVNWPEPYQTNTQINSTTNTQSNITEANNVLNDPKADQDAKNKALTVLFND